jgi:hypothetical protein
MINRFDEVLSDSYNRIMGNLLGEYYTIRNTMHAAQTGMKENAITQDEVLYSITHLNDESKIYNKPLNIEDGKWLDAEPYQVIDLDYDDIVVKDGEVDRISKFLKNQGTPQYVTSVTASEEEFNPLDDSIDGSDASDDGLYRQAVQIVKQERKASTSYIQRSLRIGYNRAAIIVERMEKDGILSEPNGMGKREILIPEE